MAGETYDVVTTCFNWRIADLITAVWYVYGIKLMTRSCFATSASRAFSSVTSRDIGLASLTPSAGFLAAWRVLHAKKGQWQGIGNYRACNLPTDTSMPESLRMSRAGLVTKLLLN
jgi:hypothetical protein